MFYLRTGLLIFSLSCLLLSVASTTRKCFTCKNCTSLNEGIVEECPLDDDYQCLIGAMEDVSPITGKRTTFFVAGCLTTIFCRVVNFDPQYVKRFIQQSNSTGMSTSTMNIIDFKCCTTDLCNYKMLNMPLNYYTSSNLETSSKTIMSTISSSNNHQSRPQASFNNDGYISQSVYVTSPPIQYYTTKMMVSNSKMESTTTCTTTTATITTTTTRRISSMRKDPTSKPMTTKKPSEFPATEPNSQPKTELRQPEPQSKLPPLPKVVSKRQPNSANPTTALSQLSTTNFLFFFSFLSILFSFINTN